MPRRPRDDDDEDDDRPRKKKRRRDDEEEYDDEDDEPTGWDRYKGSAPRYIILAILLVVMVTLGFLLFQRYQNERNAMLPMPTESIS